MDPDSDLDRRIPVAAIEPLVLTAQQFHEDHGPDQGAAQASMANDGPSRLAMPGS